MDRDIRPVGVLVLRGKNELASIDEVFCKKLGYEKPELAGASLIDIACPAEQEKCKRLLIQAAQNKGAAYNAEVRFVGKNGETIRTKLTVNPRDVRPEEECDGQSRTMRRRRSQRSI